MFTNKKINSIDKNYSNFDEKEVKSITNALDKGQDDKENGE